MFKKSGNPSGRKYCWIRCKIFAVNALVKSDSNTKLLMIYSSVINCCLSSPQGVPIIFEADSCILLEYHVDVFRSHMY